LLDACRGGTVLLHERQAFDKAQRRKPRNTVLTLRILWELWCWHRVMSNNHGRDQVWGRSL
jgi:hypothetical protein